MVDVTEVERLKGAVLEIGAGRIDGPAPLACVAPHYEVARTHAEGLFGGGLGEISDGRVSADELARRIGFKQRPIASLVTGCAVDIEYHAIDADHLVFALNNRLYRLTRTHAAAAATKP